MTYQQYCDECASVLSAYLHGFAGYYATAWRLMQLRARYGASLP